MGFVQIVEFRASDIEPMRKLGEEWERAAEGEDRTSRRVLCRDRDDPGRYLNIVFFDSHDEAMKNSELPVTQEFAQKMGALADGPPTFHNLDVVEDVS